jgi:hypothetical protein
MTIPFTTESIFFAITIIGLAFTIYRSYRDPQAKSEIGDAVMRDQIDGLKLAMEKILTNHLPHMDAKIENIHTDISILKISIAQLSVIIDERIPRK